MFMDKQQLLHMLAIALIIACIIIVFLLYKNNIENRRSIQLLEILVGIIESDNQNLNGHSLHVHNLAMVLYEFLPYRYRLKVKQKDLHYASLLLDIGKLSIPSEILERSGKLENKEWEIVKKHPDFGMDILKDLPGFVNVRSYILYHHERVDGKGYHQLAGSQIPLGSKIIAVADTYSAIVMTRSYKASLSYVDAISELRLSAGTQLDEELVKCFCDIPVNRIDACLDEVRHKMERFSVDRKGTAGV